MEFPQLDPQQINRMQRSLNGILLIVAVGVGFGGGLWYERTHSIANQDPIVKRIINGDTPSSVSVDFGLFWQVWTKLHDRYVDKTKLETQKLLYGAISGMVNAAGDPYTTFFEPVAAQKFEEEVSGAFSGVGMEIAKRDNAITVVAPIKNSPAMKAGILAGDIVTKVDGKSTETWSTEEAVSHIRGKQGTTVTISIYRKGVDHELSFTLTRDTIRIPAVELAMLEGGIGYLQIFSFNGNVDAEFERAAKELVAQKTKGVIIDVRNNPGGLLDAAVNIAGWFLPAQSVVVQERFGTGVSDQLRAHGNARLSNIPVVVIMNKGSASASEILAGALHDVRGIPLVGEKSFGKGSVQQLETFYNGSTLKVTIAKWFTPNGVSISDTGITPSVEVPSPTASESAQWQFGTPGKDKQLDRALEIIRQSK
jgi:carboxyl-terminal processing protease